MDLQLKRIRAEVSKLNSKFTSADEIMTCKADIKEVKKQCFPHVATKPKKSILHCMDCGNDWLDLRTDGKVRCPHCGAILKVENNHKRVYHSKIWFQTVSQCGNYLLVRSYTGRAETGLEPEMTEYQRCFVDEQDHEIVFSRRKGMFFSWYGNYSMDSPIEIRNSNYDPDSCMDWRIKSMTPWIKKRGLKRHDSFRCLNVISDLLKHTEFETMYKTGNIGAAYRWIHSYKYNSKISRQQVWDAFKVTVRHKPEYVRDMDKSNLWYDMLESLCYLNKDIKNPQFCAPEDLNKSHDFWIEQKKKKEAKEREKWEREAKIRRKEEQRKQAAKKQELIAEFNQRIEFFKDLKFNVQDLTIQPVLTVPEMIEEGHVMDNCVGDYWQRKNSLILVGVNPEGKHLVCIEVNLKDYSIPQCYAHNNGASPYRNEITNLLKDNYKIKLRNLKYQRYEKNCCS